MRTSGGMGVGFGLVLFEQLTDEVARVLRDVGCAHADQSGRCWVLPDSVTTWPAEVGARVASAIETRLGEPQGRFAVLDLYCGGRDRVAERPTSGLKRPPERYLDQPIALLRWLATLHETRAVHSRLIAFLTSSDPDEILPYLPWHPSGPELALDGLPLRVPGATVVVAVEALLVPDPATSGAFVAFPAGPTEPSG